MQLTQMLQRLETGDRNALNDVIPLVYQELKKLARSHLRREAGRSHLETTALVHEAFLRMAGSRQPAYENRAHFFGIASRLMRQVLVDAARAKAAVKRGSSQEVAVADVPDWGPQPDRSLLALEDALQWLEKEDPQKGQLIEMRYFGGMTVEESSMALSLPVHIVRRELRLARAWLHKQLAGVDAGVMMLHDAPAPCVSMS